MKDKTLEAIKRAARVADLWLPRKIGYERVPGMSVGIVYKGKLVYKRGFGFADASAKKRADEKTLFHIASHSKMFTSAAVMRLVEAGKLRLDDKAADYLDWFKVKSGGKDSRHITIRQLLSHTSGVFRDGRTPFWSTGRFPREIESTAGDEPLLLDNLEDFKYTNYGFALLGAIVAKASGMSYQGFVEKEIIAPLRLANTSSDYETGLQNVAKGYGVEFPDSKKSRLVFKHVRANAYASATGFVSNVEDMARFISRFALEPKKSKSFLSPESKREMMYPFADTGSGKYGLGFDIGEVEGNKTVGHGGGYGGYSTNTVFDPKLGLGVIVFTNYVHGPAGQIADGLLQTIYRYRNEQPALKGASRYEGAFRDAWGDSLVIERGNKLVAFSPEAGSPLSSRTSYEPTGVPGEFVMRTKNKFSPYGEKIRFEKLVNGKYTEIRSAGALMKRTG